MGFPGASTVKNLPTNAGDSSSIPDPGRSHMPGSNLTRWPQLLSLWSRAQELQLLSPSATTTEAQGPEACAPQQKKATAIRRLRNSMKSSPPLAATTEKPPQQQRPSKPKINTF